MLTVIVIYDTLLVMQVTISYAKTGTSNYEKQHLVTCVGNTNEVHKSTDGTYFPVELSIGIHIKYI